ncbi:MAG: J domain-containing protein [Oligoflexia bacterium]|nr:J domain-containing protein [Oligoflexia bacterium]
MSRLKAFLIADGIIIVIGIIFFAFLLLRRQKNDQGFRDDLWVEQERKRSFTGNSKVVEDQIDQKILLEDNRVKPEQTQAQQAQQSKSEFRYPNFRGGPYEILGVPASADKELVTRAYKHWMKKYHPDRVSHLGSQHIEQAKVRAGQLNRAREEILKRIK